MRKQFLFLFLTMIHIVSFAAEESNPIPKLQDDANTNSIYYDEHVSVTPRGLVYTIPNGQPLVYDYPSQGKFYEAVYKSIVTGDPFYRIKYKTTPHFKYADDRWEPVFNDGKNYSRSDILRDKLVLLKNLDFPHWDSSSPEKREESFLRGQTISIPSGIFPLFKKKYEGQDIYFILDDVGEVVWSNNHSRYPVTSKLAEASAAATSTHRGLSSTPSASAAAGVSQTHEVPLPSPSTPQPVYRGGQTTQSGPLLAPFSIMRAIDECLTATRATDMLNAQQNFKQQYLSYSQQGDKRLTAFNNQELIATASNNYNLLNNVLATHGFSIRLNPFPTNGLGVVTIQKILVQWLFKGSNGTLTLNDSQKFPVVIMKNSTREPNMRFDKFGAEITVIQLVTKSNDLVYMAAKKDKPYFGHPPTEDEISLEINAIKDAISSKKGQSSYYNELVFPMIDCKVEKQLDTLMGLRFGAYTVNQALQEIKFQMNEIGAKFETAVTVGMMRGSAPISQPTRYIINQPFLIWVEREEIIPTIFEGYMTMDYWKNPGHW